MRIEEIKERNYSYSYIEQVLYNRGIKKEDFDKFLNFKPVISDPLMLLNIDKAFDLLIKHIKNKSKIYIIVDSDCDGYTSSAALSIYLHKVFPDLALNYIFHDGKQHGIELDKIPEDCELLIIPDASSNEIEKHIELYNKGIEIIILDHHLYDINKETPAIIVNCQDGNYPNNQLCGAGVVLQFCRYIDDKYSVKYANDIVDIVALGHIADMMQMTSIETTSIIIVGLLNINNKLFTDIINKQSFSMKKITPISVAFYVAPLINAVIRSGTMEEKQTVFNAFITPLEVVKSTKRGASEDETEFLSTKAIRYMINCKNRQTKEVDKEMAKIETKIQQDNLLNNKILLITLDYEINKSLIGLIANKIASKYKRPTLVLNNTINNELSGSGRNYKNSEIEDFNQFLSNMGLFNFCEGHANAFGSNIDKNNIEDFIKNSNSKLEDYDFDDVIKVDFIFNKKCDQGVITELSNYDSFYGQGLSEPVICVKNMLINKSNCSLIGNKKDTLKIIGQNNISYMKFRLSEEEVDSFNSIINSNDNVLINIAGKPNINTWGSNTTEQIFIDSYEINFAPIF